MAPKKGGKPKAGAVAQAKGKAKAKAAQQSKLELPALEDQPNPTGPEGEAQQADEQHDESSELGMPKLGRVGDIDVAADEDYISDDDPPPLRGQAYMFARQLPEGQEGAEGRLHQGAQQDHQQGGSQDHIVQGEDRDPNGDSKTIAKILFVWLL